MIISVRGLRSEGNNGRTLVQRLLNWIWMLVDSTNAKLNHAPPTLRFICSNLSLARISSHRTNGKWEEDAKRKTNRLFGSVLRRHSKLLLSPIFLSLSDSFCSFIKREYLWFPETNSLLQLVTLMQMVLRIVTIFIGNNGKIITRRKMER